MTPAMKPLLFQRWPDLDLPWVSLGTWPTPLTRLEVPGVGPIWVKDEGRSGEPYGGNKVRKLEFLLGDARDSGARSLLTMGNVGSHHVLATAVYGRRLGVLPYAVLVGQPDTEHIRENARAIDALCEGWVPARRYADVVSAWPRALANITAVNGCAPHVVAIGGSDALGTIGWISGGLELAAALERGEIDRIDRVYTALGSAGSAAGLLLGLRLGGVRAEVVAVRVVGRTMVNALRVRQLARQAVEVLRRHGADVGEVALGGLRVHHGWYAGGYGRADHRVTQVIERAAGLGVEVEATYTAKTLGACLEEVESTGGLRAVYVHTVNAQPLAPLLAEAPATLPERMRPLLY